MSETLELGSIPNNSMSHTMYSMYLRCAKQFEYRYLEKLIEPPSGNLILGKGVHSGLEGGFNEHIKQGKPPPLKRVQEMAVAALEDTFETVAPSSVEWSNGDSVSKLKDDSVRLLSVYDSVRTGLQPARVEETFKIGLKDLDWTINGRIDLSTKDASIIDFKTANRTPNADVADKSEQLTLYQIGVPANADAAKSLEIHALVRKKVPEAVVFKSSPRPPAAQSDLLRNMASVALLIRTGIFPKAQESNFGSPCSYCGYYERCRGKKRPEKGE